MKRLLSIFLFCAVLVSCGPSKYSVAVELSSPSKSGITLAGKTISVAYTNSGVSADSAFLAYTADSFIETLEKEYFDGEEAVPLYKVDSEPGKDNTSKEGMLDLLMETGTDLVFLFDVAPSGSSSTPSILTLYAYDALNKADTVQSFTGKVTLGKWDPDLYGHVVGEKSADIFSPSWVREYIYFYYFSSDKWNEAVEAASEYRFKDATDIWLTLVSSKDQYKAACAQYNIAAVCYIYGHYDLAAKWLDQADKLYPIPESTTLRKKINSRS
ncbi:MAG: DUF6340 family protein [Bacteroidales bacterium]|nr:DUF6340 family protein [Bacteroidales bacterium]